MVVSQGAFALMIFTDRLFMSYLDAAHIAAAKSSVITKIDLDTPSLGEYDPVVSGVKFDNAEIMITDAPGLGITEVGNLEMLDTECS